ncbi:hypothetical protein [Paludisphaera sp.]|uniref:hypothetical protein n=1 Tax=Paludisphaera sp. TaxID=2017432 RepID=UPI00301DFBF8
MLDVVFREDCGRIRAKHAVPILGKAHRPRWPSIKKAEAELRRQAEEVGGTATVTALVIDASLP